MSDTTLLVRFVPRDDLPGPQLLGRLVFDRRTGRPVSDTLDDLRPPKGAPGNARLVVDYGPADGAAGNDPLSLPRRLTETVAPADLWISMPPGRVRVVKTVRTFTRLAEPAP
ncbi:MAG: hypothetical protein ACK54K_01770 [Gemmatimonadaceae bacterium]